MKVRYCLFNLFSFYFNVWQLSVTNLLLFLAAERRETLSVARVNVHAGKGEVDIPLTLGHVETPSSGS
jgi:hypothetical protein